MATSLSEAVVQWYAEKRSDVIGQSVPIDQVQSEIVSYLEGGSEARKSAIGRLVVNLLPNCSRRRKRVGGELQNFYFFEED